MYFVNILLHYLMVLYLVVIAVVPGSDGHYGDRE